MGCGFWKKCSDCEKNTDNHESFNEYTLRRKNDKIKLHAKYISFISLGIVIWLLATGTYTHEFFPDWVSFASTITSIILSVIAIILSITGESKTDAIKNDLLETARKLDGVTDKMSEEMLGTNKEIRELISQLDEQIKILQEKVDKVPENINNYTKTNKTYPNAKNKTVKNKVDWGANKNEG